MKPLQYAIVGAVGLGLSYFLRVPLLAGAGLYLLGFFARGWSATPKMLDRGEQIVRQIPQYARQQYQQMQQQQQQQQPQVQMGPPAQQFSSTYDSEGIPTAMPPDPNSYAQPVAPPVGYSPPYSGGSSFGGFGSSFGASTSPGVPVTGIGGAVGEASYTVQMG